MQGKLGWVPTIIVSLSILLFAYGLYSAYLTGSILGEARNDFISKTTVSADIQGKPRDLASCWAKSGPHAPNEMACSQAWTKSLSDTVAGRKQVMKGVLRWTDGWAVGLVAASPRPLQAPYFLMLASLVALFAAVGYGVTGSIWGIVVNQNHRLSLSQTQAVLWSTIIISGYAVMALFNVGAMAWSTATLDTGNEIFPDIDWTIFALMGLAAAVPMTTTMISDARPLDAAYSAKGMIGGAQIGLAASERNDTAQKASLFDLFLGEDIETKGRIDLTRVQNVLFSVLLLMAYSSALVSSFQLLGPSVLLDSASSGARIFEAMPSPGANFLTLAGLANATYLIGKFTPGKPEPAQPASAAGTAAADQNIGAEI